jgi:glycosyltransferase involved in cell wall biosynthesis
MTHTKLQIAVAMCTYNGEKYLREQLVSLAQQTRLPDELVICDDCSSDATPDIIEEFSRTAPFPVRFFRNSINLRSTKNFEQAIALCEGDFIALCDQDDIWLPEKLARELAIMESDPSLGGVFCDGELIDASSHPIGKRLWTNVFFTPREQGRFQSGCGVEVLLKRNVVTGATFMFRARLRPLFMPIPAIWVHDGWIAWMLLAHSKLTFIPEPLMQYRLHAGQQIGVEAVTLSQLSLRERLQKGKQAEPAKHLAVAAELEELRRILLTSDIPKNRATAHRLTDKITFLRDRAAPAPNQGAKALQLLMHTRDYHRYESGWKFLLRDIVMVFV